MMRIVVAHNRYVSANPSGENAVVDDEVRGLREAGHDVIPFFRDSDEIASMGAKARVVLAASPVYSRRSAHDLAQLIASHRPDVVHLHNPYPLVSPWIVRTASRLGVPVVQTVHNYRHACVAGTLFRDGRACEDCLAQRLPWPAVVHGCYRGSRPQSLVMGAAQVVHRPTWLLVRRFMVLTGFMGSKLAAAGVPADRMVLRPTAVADPGAHSQPGRGLLFVGRLSEEKGADLLVDAWRRSGLGRAHRLTLAGDGPMLERFRHDATTTPGLTVLGRVSPERVGELMRTHAAVVAPSLCYEGFPRVVVEAFAHARPVIASAVGSLAEIVDAQVGWTSAPTEDALAETLRRALSSDLVSPGRIARSRYEAHYRPDRVMDQLHEVYRQAIDA